MSDGIFSKAATIALAATLSGGIAVARGYWPKSFESENGLAQLCFEHPGANGRANIAPITIEIQNEAELTIHGESAVCYFLGAGAAKVSLRFSYPYDSATSRFWTTPAIALDVHRGRTTTLYVCATQQARDANWEKTGWHSMWTLRRIPWSATLPCGRV